MQSLVKSRNDKLLYRYVELPSRMRCVLVSDAETEKSAAVVAVNVGSMHEPLSHAGLAHFLEHMLFKGSATFPDPGGYLNFISQAGGFANAYTANTETCYYFSIPNAQFGAALDMFAEFFVSPLLRPDSVDKELNAVNSEHEKNLLSDRWRLEQVFKALADPASPYHKSFYTGSLATLQRPDVHERVRDFYHAAYSANLMALVLYSNRPLDELEQLAREKFAGVADKAVERPRFAGQALYTAAQMGRLARVRSIAKGSKLQLRFLFRSLQADFRRKPLQLVGHLLGHEGEGSLLSQLIAEKLAHALSAQEEHLADAHSFLELTVSLTPAGLAAVERVLLLVGQYVRNLDRRVPQAVFDEYKLVLQMKFDFAQKKHEVARSLRTANSLLLFPVEHALSNEYYLEAYEPEAYAEVLDGLRLDNAVVLLSSDTFEGLPLREEVYGTEYGLEALSPELVARFADPQLDVRDRLRLPPPNPFIPRHFELKAGADMPRPQRLAVPGRGEAGELFFQKTAAFGLPRAQVTYQFNTRRARDASNARVQLCAQLWCDLLQERLKEYAYLAETADMRFQLQPNARGFEVSVRGFDDSVTRFFKGLGERFFAFSALAATPELLRADFENKKTQLREELMQQLARGLFHHALQACGWTMETDQHAVPRLLEELEHLCFEEYLAYHVNGVTRFSFEALISGNLLAEEALRLHGEFFDALGAAAAHTLDALDAAQGRVPALQASRTFLLQSPAPMPDDSNSVIAILLQGVQDESQSVLLKLANKLLSGPFFDELRTRQQLGYVVLTLDMVQKGVLHFLFLIQSGVAVSHDVARRIYAHLDAMRAHVRDLPAEDFEQARRGLISELSQPFFSLDDQHRHFYAEIFKHRYAFDWRERALELLRGLGQPAFNDFFERFFFTERKALELHFTAARDAAANERVFEERRAAEPALYPLADERALHALLPLYPDGYARLAP